MTILGEKNGLNCDQLEQQMEELGGMMLHSHEEVLAECALNQPFRSSSFVLILLLRGTLTFQYNLINYTLKENDMFFMLPEAMNEMLFFSKDVQFLSLAFTNEYLKRQGVMFNGRDAVHIFSDDFQRQISLSPDEFQDMVSLFRILKKKTALPSQTTRMQEMIRHSFLSIIYEARLIHQKYWMEEVIGLNRQEELTTQFLALLATNFKKDRKVQSYASLLCVTPRHLSQVVKQITGKTAGEFIDELVIKEAKILLSSHLLNVAQVAGDLQFSDQSFFGKYFKKHAGISPSAYRANTYIRPNMPF